MKRRILNRALALVVLALIAIISSGCLRQNYLIFEDGDFDGIEFSDYDLLNNAELDMDDVDRN